MNITEIPFARLRLQYRIARAPLELVDQRIVSQMDAEAPLRLLYERSIGSLDAGIGNILRDSKLRLRGTALAERSEALGRAAALDAAAASRKQEAEAEMQQGGQKAATAKEHAREMNRQEVVDALKDARDRKQDAAETAAKRTKAAKDRIDETAAESARSTEKAKRAAVGRADAVEGMKTAVADAKLEDAGERAAKAENKLALADRVENLADTEEARRKAAWASDGAWFR
jgi:hypothetical protein